MKRVLRGVILWLGLLVLPVKAAAAELIPVGQVIGLQLYNDRVTVAAYDDILGGTARSAGLKIGDQILEIDGKTVACAEDVRGALQSSEGEVSLTVRRAGKERQLRFSPANTEDGPKMGVFLRQGIAGIGTVTFYDPQTGAFAALGHGITDVDTGKLMPLSRGSVMAASVKAVKRGASGSPGELRGDFDLTRDLGSLYANTECGIFGVLPEENRPEAVGEAIPVARRAEVHTGKAVILANCKGDEVCTYEIEIEKLYGGSAPTRNLLLRVTDPTLIALTGGIVQGMSGSPIVQDGKLVGAVTHVLLDDPQRGYGILAENMLSASGMTAQSAASA